MSIEPSSGENSANLPKELQVSEIPQASAEEADDLELDIDSLPKWINNDGSEVEEVFGFNENAELVNARVAMIGFLMLILTELAFAGEPATQKIFGIN